MKTSDVTIYNSLVDFSQCLSGKQRGMVVTLLMSIRALIVGEYSKSGFEKASNMNINWKYFLTVLEAWNGIKNAKNPTSTLLTKATCKEVASFH